MNENTYTFCGDTLKQHINHKHLTLEVVAKSVGVNKNTLNRATNSKQITIDSLLKICNYLQVPPTELFINNSTTEHTSTITAQEEKISYQKDTVEPTTPSVQEHYEMSKDEEIAMLRKLNNNYLKQIKQLEALLRKKNRQE